MIDSNIFPQLNRQLIFEEDRLLLNYSKLDYTLSISLKDQQVSKLSKIAPKNPLSVKPFIAVYGIIQLQRFKYLIVVTMASAIGQIMKKTIFRVQKLQFICLSQSKSSIDATYISGLEQVLDNQSLYFSFGYDLTVPFQRFVQNNCQIGQSRKQYMYNEIWTKDLKLNEANQWTTRFISGFVAINYVELNQQQSIDICLISRRDKGRQGIRYLTRGINKKGNAANTCQTQTILCFQRTGFQKYFSYVQLRGSLPFLWNQDPDMKFKPECTIDNNHQLNKELAEKHYKKIQEEYSKCKLINLVDHKNFQQRLGNYFENLNNQINKQGFDLIWFDFHQQCRKMRYQNLTKLLDQILSTLKEFSYCCLEHKDNEGNKFVQIKRQKGVIRTNCIDCLDRTNVVQSVIARYMLLKWLSKVGVREYSAQLSAFQKLPQELEQIFKDQWTENANRLSFLYAGTDAMKIDLTKTGKRTLGGAIHDLKVGIERYFLGNFVDSRKQDYIHLSLGQIKPNQHPSQRIRHSNLNSFHVVLAVFLTIPFLVSYQVNQFSENAQSKIGLKVGLTALAYFLFYKAANKLRHFIVRKPIPISGQ